MANKATKTNHTTRPLSAVDQLGGPEPIQEGREPLPLKVARQIYEQVQSRLKSEFGHFREYSTLEEKRLLIEILNDHTNRSGSLARRPGEHEVALYSAIQRQLDDCLCVVVPCDDWVPLVENFIAALHRKTWKRAPYDPSKRETADELRDRLAKSFRSEVEIFARDAGQPSLSLMRDILARWNELAHDPELKGFPNTLEVAAQIELDKLRADTAAEAQAA
jgi:hypothetical protein